MGLCKFRIKFPSHWPKNTITPTEKYLERSNITDRPLEITRFIWTFSVGSRKGSEGGAGGKGHGADRTHLRQEDGGCNAERGELSLVCSVS